MNDRAHYLLLAQSRLQNWRASHPSQTETSHPGENDDRLLTSASEQSENGRKWNLPDLAYDLPPAPTSGVNEQDRAIQEELAIEQAKLLQRTLNGFKVATEVLPTDICIGPTVTRFGIRPTGIPEFVKNERTGQMEPRREANGEIVYKEKTKSSKIVALRNDLALALETKALRMESPVPGRPYVGAEIPNRQPRIVTLHEVFQSPEYRTALAKSTLKLIFALGQDVAGTIQIGDLSTMPHLLIAGATGTGKSVCLNALIASILLQASPEEVKMLMIDPKMVELKPYDGIPHLLMPVVIDPAQTVPVLKNAIQEMERRYKLLSSLGAKNLEKYRKLRQERLAQGDTSLENLPAILIIIDELADLLMTAPDEIEDLICRLAQLARAVGIHLVLATQRPSVDVVTGKIKANVPARIAFMVSSSVDSRTILDRGGAEELLGRGDMLCQAAKDAPAPIRVQGAFQEDDFIEALVSWWKAEVMRQLTGTATPPTPGHAIQLPLDPAWMIPAELAKAPQSAKPARNNAPAISEAELLEHLKHFLLHGWTLINGQQEETPLPFEIKMLEWEDRYLVAEAATWRGHRGSGEKLNDVLKTKLGPKLRDALVERGLLDKQTQQPIKPSERLLPLLYECGILDQPEATAPAEDESYPIETEATP